MLPPDAENRAEVTSAVVATAVQPPAVENAPESIPALTVPPEIPVEYQIPLSLERRCSQLDLGQTYADEIMVERDFLLSLSDREHKALADSEEDGFFNFFYGERLMFRYWEERERGVDPEELGRLLETMNEYYIRATRNHSWQAASWIAWHYWNIDKVKARAWWRIEDGRKRTGSPATRLGPVYIHRSRE